MDKDEIIKKQKAEIEMLHQQFFRMDQRNNDLAERVIKQQERIDSLLEQKANLLLGKTVKMKVSYITELGQTVKE